MSKDTKFYKTEFLFLLFHLLGWYGLAFGNEILNLVSIQATSYDDIASTFLSISLGCFFTYFFRWMTIVFKWRFSIKVHLFIFPLGILMMAALSTLIDTYLEWYWWQLDYFNAIDFLSLFFNLGRYITMWMVLFYFYKIGQIRNQQLDKQLIVEKKIAYLDSEVTRLNIGVLTWGNVLTTIQSQAVKDPQLARELILNFSEILRDFLNYDNKDKITLSQEIKMLKLWLNIENARLSNYLPEVIIHFDPNDSPNLALLPHSLIGIVNFLLQHYNAEKAGKGIKINMSLTEVSILIQCLHTHKELEKYFHTDNIMQYLQDALRYLPTTTNLQIHQTNDELCQIDLPFLR